MAPSAPSPLPEPPPPLAGAGPLGLRAGREGGAETVVLLHGLGRVGAMWAGVARGLAAGGCRVLIPDNPGVGLSAAVPIPRTIEEHARLHLRTLEGLGIQAPVHLVGLSMGGMIALALAALLGPRTASLAVLASSSRETGLRRLAPGAVLRVVLRYLLTRSPARASLPELLGPDARARTRQLAAAVDTLQAGRRLLPTLKGQLLAAARFRARPYVGRLPGRTLLAVGGCDRLVPVSNSLRLCRILGVPLQVIPRWGHDLSLEDPEGLASLLLGHMHPQARSREPGS